MGEYVLIILELAFLYFPLVLGGYISISLMKIPDLSIEAAFVFGAITAARSVPLLQQLPSIVYLPLVLLTATLGGVVVGLLSATLTRRAKIPHLLSSILTIGIFHGINQYVLGMANFSLSRYVNPLACKGIFQRHPEFITLAAVSLLLAGGAYFLLRRQLGYSLAIFGNNPHFFDHYGINAHYVFFMGIILSNGLAGLAGYLVAQSSGFADVNAGFGMALFCVTCVILGKTFTSRRRLFSVAVPIVGVLAYCCIQQVLLKVGFNLKYFTMIQSLLVLAVLVMRYRKAQGKKLNIDNLGV